jgi:hypothetical protein
MGLQLSYDLLTAIQNRASLALKEWTVPSRDPGSPSLLLDALNREDTAAPELDLFDASPLLDRLDLGGLVGEGDTTPDVRQWLTGAIGNLGGLHGVAHQVLSGNPTAIVRGLVDRLRTGGSAGGGRLPDMVGGILRRQLGVGISFVTTLTNLETADLPEQVVGGWKSYFFGENGFQTVDGIEIIAPGHSGLLASLTPASVASAALDPDGFKQGLRGLRGLLNERSGEQYVRDLIRIVVEVGGDLRYQLPARRGELMTLVRDQDKATRWFKGAASMAESLVTSAVEEALLGVAQFQTNPMLAASAATYAGTAARKATQHAFLSHIPIPLR